MSNWLFCPINTEYIFLQVLVMDPLSMDSIPLIALAKSLYLTAPLRIGFVFITNFNASTTGLIDPSIAVNNAFRYFMETKNPNDAMDFLTTVGIS